MYMAKIRSISALRPMAWKGKITWGTVLSLLHTAFTSDKNIPCTSPYDILSEETNVQNQKQLFSNSWKGNGKSQQPFFTMKRLITGYVKA